MSGDHGGPDDAPVGDEVVGFLGERPTRAGLAGWSETWIGGVSSVWRRRVGSATVAGVGAVIVAIPFYHLFHHEASLDAFLGDVLPLTFGIALIGTGLWLHWGNDDDDVAPLVTGFWVTICSVVVAIVSLYFLFLHTAHGHTVESPWFLVYDVAATGAVGGLLISRYDLRARYRHRRLSRHERRFRAVFEGTLDALVITDDEGRYVAANPAAADLFGVSRSELIGKHIADFAAEDVDLEAQWSTFLDADEPRGTFELVRPDGEIRTVAVAATANVLPGRHLSALRDVTERVEHERELHEERARVEFLNRLLRHNVLNGMNLVMAKLDSLEPALPDERRSDLDVARNRSAEVVDIVQTARRLAAGMEETAELPRIDLGESLTAAIESVREAYPAATIEFAPPDVPVDVRADEMLATAFDHLLTNAMEHNDPESISVTIDVELDAETVTVAVADDGVGIPPARRAELFSEGEFTHTRDWGGFGLSIVDVLVREYGGRVWAEANEPRGTVFYVELPRAT
ncbi:MAG: PAS domain-containing sensor histidine kinase [Haloplanus sp.]